jgi:hypothetical protein
VLRIEPDKSVVLVDGERDPVLTLLLVKLNRSREEEVARRGSSLLHSAMFAAHKLVSAKIDRQFSGSPWPLLLLCLRLIEIKTCRRTLSKADRA